MPFMVGNTLEAKMFWKLYRLGLLHRHSLGCIYGIILSKNLIYHAVKALTLQIGLCFNGQCISPTLTTLDLMHGQEIWDWINFSSFAGQLPVQDLQDSTKGHLQIAISSYHSLHASSTTLVIKFQYKFKGTVRYCILCHNKHWCSDCCKKNVLWYTIQNHKVYPLY